MPRQQALTVIKRVTNDLRTGVPWSKVYERYSEEFNYPPKPDGSQRTKIGLLGHLVIFPDPLLGKGYMANITPRNSTYEVVQRQGPPPPRRLWSLDYFDSAHLPALLKANVGVASLKNLPYGFYALTVGHAGFATSSLKIEIRSAVPQSREITLDVETVHTAVVVAESATMIDPNRTGSAYYVGAQNFPGAKPSVPGNFKVHAQIAN